MSLIVYTAYDVPFSLTS